MASFAPQFALAIVGSGRWRGQVSMSCCPGRATQQLFPSMSQDQLERDVGTIARWGAKALVTLLDVVELARLQVQKLPSLAPAAKLAWYHLPLSCGMLPDAEFDRSWNNVSLRLQDILREGGKVSMHCQDGGDRTGLITARLLIELGCQPQDAMNGVRAARPGILRSAELVDYLRGMQSGRLHAVGQLESFKHTGSVAVGLHTAMASGRPARFALAQRERRRRGGLEPMGISAPGAQHLSYFSSVARSDTAIPPSS